MRTSTLIGPALDWAVAKCEGFSYAGYAEARKKWERGSAPPNWSPSTDWAQGGPIIEREKIDLCWSPGRIACMATVSARWPEELDCGLRCIYAHGPTPLIAAMRGFVASKFGYEIEIPKELQ